MKKILVVIDVQNDFIDGSLRNEEAIKVVPNIVEKIKSFDGDAIYATKDTHFENYLETPEGKKLPFVHCVRETTGWEINKDVDAALNEKATEGNCDVVIIEKPTFGAFNLLQDLDERYPEDVLNLEFVGFCTDICVVSNVLLAKAAFYANSNITVDASCCAGVSVDKHNAALLTMKSCQVDIVNWADDPDLKKED